MNDATVAEPHSSAPRRASGSSFYTAMRILPRAQREAMFEVYSFCRLVDDVADSTEPHIQRRLRLAEWRRHIELLYAGRPTADLRALAHAVRDFSLRKEDFLAVIDGMEMDAAEDIRAPDWAKLDLYCDRVASAVGRLSVRVFGMGEQDGIALSHHLGRALQLTNILRDIDEDAEIGRLYLPLEELRKAGIVATAPPAVLASAGLGQVCDAVAARALRHFQEADTIMARNPRRSVKAPRIMEEVYRIMLQGMMARGWNPPRTRISVSALRLSWIAVQYAII
ncbi:MAG: presqualene diphosphate synthase [Alphaproteobacteria bacterium]|jgi:phytoene synthase|nr:presqualene diphosphate synthase [Alphaproteobacteria bacterium]